MPCCNKKANCSSEKSTKTTQPDESYTRTALKFSEISAGLDLLQQLVLVARAGLHDHAVKIIAAANFENIQLRNLAELLTTLIAENTRLKKEPPSAPDANVADNDAEIYVQNSVLNLIFGPRNQYRLSVPIFDEKIRQKLIRQLRIAAVELESSEPAAKVTNKDQKVFPFISAE